MIKIDSFGAFAPNQVDTIQSVDPWPLLSLVCVGRAGRLIILGLGPKSRNPEPCRKWHRDRPAGDRRDDQRGRTTIGTRPVGSNVIAA
jgi:hypothetical protein